MFSKVKAGDKVLVEVPGESHSSFDRGRTFLIPALVGGCTPTRFTVRGITYKKEDGGSYPLGKGCCQPYEADKDETSKLKECNSRAIACRKVNYHLRSFGRSRIDMDTKNPHAILKQAEILAALIEER